MTSKPDGPERSPDFLHAPTRAGLGVRRLNRMPLLIASGLVILVIGAIGYTYQARTASAAINGTRQNAQKAEPASAASILDQAPEAGHIEQTPSAILPPKPVDTQPQTRAQAPAPNPYEDAQYRQWEQEQQETNQVQESYRSNWQNALGASTTIFAGKTPQTPALTGSVTKQQGVPEERDQSNSLLTSRVQAVSPYELKAGTVIPSVMISGVNSELPGQLTAQVSENVFDTATGRYLLIPQGSKLVGTYEHNVVTGQHRILIAWNRIIYPDASSLDLGAMAGSDQSGYAGFQDKTNNHTWPTFRNALLLSAITAGIQLSQAQPQQGNAAYSSQQVIAGSLGMQMGQLGMGAIQRGMSLPPTLSIRPGYRFNVMVSKDIILLPWQHVVSHLR